MRHAFLTSAMLPLLAACQSSGGHVVQPPSSVDMRQGQSITLPDGGRLTYAGVRSDSRCRPDVQCIWAGDAEAGFRWQPPAGAASDIVLHTNAQFATSARVGKWQLTLTALDWNSPPRAKLRLETPR